MMVQNSDWINILLYEDLLDWESKVMAFESFYLKLETAFICQKSLSFNKGMIYLNS